MQQCTLTNMGGTNLGMEDALPYLIVAVVPDYSPQERFGPLSWIAHPPLQIFPSSQSFWVTNGPALRQPGPSCPLVILLPFLRPNTPPPNMPLRGGESSYIISTLLTSMAGPLRLGSGAVLFAAPSQGY